MRNREAARYARWSAVAAALMVLVVVGAYVYRAAERARERRAMPAAVPASVASQSAQFTYSKVEQDRTVFTIRASEATRYKRHDRALLEDVWISIYGRDGKQNENIHTRECSYDPQSGGARCEGSVQMDMGGAPSSAGHFIHPTLRLLTRDLTFDQKTGNAWTSAPVKFTFSGGSGSGVGVKYSMQDATVRVERSIEFRLSASEKTGGLPVSATGSSLEIHRNDRTVVLEGPVTVREGSRELSAAKIDVDFDTENHVKEVLVAGSPVIHAIEHGVEMTLSATEFDALINRAGWLERVVAEGRVRATRRMKASDGRFAAGHVEWTMAPGTNLVEGMTATDGVAAESRHGGETDTLGTDALRVRFSPRRSPTGIRATTAPADFHGERIESVETLAPSRIEIRKPQETATIRAQKLLAQAGADGRLAKLYGDSGVSIRRQVAGRQPQVASARKLTAMIGPHGQWQTVEESGGVLIEQGDRRARAHVARIDRATDAMELEGSPVVIGDGMRTSAATMVLHPNTGALEASGGVASTYVSSGGEDAVRLGAGAAHLSADSLSGSATSGHFTYRGHVRLWQGEAVLEAHRIDLWRDDQKMQASGNVVAVFPESAGASLSNLAKLGGKSAKGSRPTLWQIRAPMLTYWGDQGRAHLEGGVVASSDQGRLRSQVLDVYLGRRVRKPAAASSGGNSRSARRWSAASQGGSGWLLERAVARGNVVVEQGLRRGTADRAEYTAADGKFVLSGGSPTVTDGSSNTATGSSLTFYVASDTILIDSEEGSRTLTKHKVEK